MNIIAETTETRSMSPAEWQARVDLAAVYRLVAHHGWDDDIYNHCSTRSRGRSKATDEAARAAVEGGHGVEPRQGEHGRGPRRAGRRQSPGLHAARRRPA